MALGAQRFGKGREADRTWSHTAECGGQGTEWGLAERSCWGVDGCNKRPPPFGSSCLRKSQGHSWWPFSSEWEVEIRGDIADVWRMCYLVFLIAPSVSEGKALSCNIDLVTLGNSLIFRIINNIFICSVIIFRLCLTSELKNIISYQIWRCVLFLRFESGMWNNIDTYDLLGNLNDSKEV